MDARLRKKCPNPPRFWALSAKSAAKTGQKPTQTLAGQCIAIPPKLPQIWGRQEAWAVVHHRTGAPTIPTMLRTSDLSHTSFIDFGFVLVTPFCVLPRSSSHGVIG